MYEAIATVSRNNEEWNVTIYSYYNSYEEALDGIKRFMQTYDGTEIHVKAILLNYVE